MTMFQGYDMSALLINKSKPMEAFTAREVKRAQMSRPKKPEPVLPVSSLKEKEHDPIQDYIQAGDLDKHPEVFEQIMKELNLSAFWEFLMHSEHHSVVVPLAKNRMLNFYEGATRGGLSKGNLKAGIIVCIMSATVLSDRDNMQMEQATGPLGILYPRIKVNLRLPCLSNVDNLILLTAEQALGHLTKTATPNATKMGADRLGAYILNALRMWIVSDDEEVLKFMALCGERMPYMKPSARNNFTVRNQLGYGDALRYRSNVMCDFTTPWAVGKSMNRNAVARMNRLINPVAM